VHKTVLAFVATGLALPAAAGSVFEMTPSGSSGVAQTISIQDGKLRIEVPAMSNAPATTMILADEELLILNEAEGGFYRLTPETIEELGQALGQVNDQLSAAMAQMQEQLANLPPQQREMMERMMRDRMPNMAAATEAPPPMRVEQGAGQTVGGYACTDYSIYSGDTLIQEMCAADFSSVPGAQEVAGALENMQSFFAGLRDAMPPALAGMRNNPFDVMTQVEGFPVRTRTYINGSLQQELVLSSAETRDLPASLFEVPAGLTERDLLPEGGPF
jgi:hypothetical protein